MLEGHFLDIFRNTAQSRSVGGRVSWPQKGSVQACASRQYICAAAQYLPPNMLRYDAILVQGAHNSPLERHMLAHCAHATWCATTLSVCFSVTLLLIHFLLLTYPLCMVSHWPVTTYHMLTLTTLHTLCTITVVTVKHTASCTRTACFLSAAAHSPLAKSWPWYPDCPPISPARCTSVIHKSLPRVCKEPTLGSGRTLTLGGEDATCGSGEASQDHHSTTLPDHSLQRVCERRAEGGRCGGEKRKI